MNTKSRKRTLQVVCAWMHPVVATANRNTRYCPQRAKLGSKLHCCFVLQQLRLLVLRKGKLRVMRCLYAADGTYWIVVVTSQNLAGDILRPCVTAKVIFCRNEVKGDTVFFTVWSAVIFEYIDLQRLLSKILSRQYLDYFDS